MSANPSPNTNLAIANVLLAVAHAGGTAWAVGYYYTGSGSDTDNGVGADGCGPAVESADRLVADRVGLQAGQEPVAVNEQHDAGVVLVVADVGGDRRAVLDRRSQQLLPVSCPFWRTTSLPLMVIRSPWGRTSTLRYSRLVGRACSGYEVSRART